jgi:hypothetical protein
MKLAARSLSLTPSFPIAQTVIVPLAAAPWLAPPDAAAPDAPADDPADDAPADCEAPDAPAPEDAAVDAAADAPAPEDAAADAAPLPLPPLFDPQLASTNATAARAAAIRSGRLVVGSTFDVASC